MDYGAWRLIVRERKVSYRSGLMPSTTCVRHFSPVCEVSYRFEARDLLIGIADHLLNIWIGSGRGDCLHHTTFGSTLAVLLHSDVSPVVWVA